MKFKFVLGLMCIVFCVSANFAQKEITIKKKSSMKMEGLPAMPKMPVGMKNPLDETNNRTSTVYIKGSRMRNDAVYKQSGSKESITQTIIFQTDKKQLITFSNKKKKYYVDSIVPPTSASVKNSKKGGVVTVTGGVTDTGERAKLFGFNARHLKETITMTPSKNACMQYTIQVEIEGWYADYDEFLCPITRPKQEFQTDKNCYDEFDFQNKGGIAGIALKEIKKMTMQGITIITEEEATEILKTPLADSLFEPPADYKAASSLKEVEDDSSDDTNTTSRTMPQTSMPVKNPSPTLSLPSGGIEKPILTKKKTGMLRIGIAKPKVITPDSKKDLSAGDDIATAATKLLVESLRSENVEAVQLDCQIIISYF